MISKVDLFREIEKMSDEGYALMAPVVENIIRFDKEKKEQERMLAFDNICAFFDKQEYKGWDDEEEMIQELTQDRDFLEVKLENPEALSPREMFQRLRSQEK